MKKQIVNVERRSDCGLSMALEALGDRWSLLILRDLMFTEKRSYSELQSSEEGIATNILASRLAALEGNQIIRKYSDITNGRRSLYYLTQKGIDLVPVVLELMHWMSVYNPQAAVCSKQMKAFRKDRVSTISNYMEQLKIQHLEDHE